jgi:hypothetical protein
MLNSNSKAGTGAESSNAAEVSTSSQTITKPNVIGSFYRYEAVEYASIGYDGEYESPKFPNPKVELREFNLWKETPKGYWIGYGNANWTGKLKGFGHWVSKTTRKRFAYPTKKEALENFIKRNERRVKILSRQLETCEISISIAKRIAV